MTWNRYALLPALGTLASLAGAQSLSSPGNVPVVGSSFLVHTAAYVAPPAAGPDQLFDYQALVGTGTATYSWIDPADYSNPSVFPTAQMAVTTGGPDTLFYRNTATGLEKVGERRVYLGTYTVEAPFSDGALELKLPLAYSDNWTDAIAGTFNIDGNPAVRSGSVTGVADATGHVHLPGGSITHVLRVRTRVNETTTFNPGIPITVTHRRTEYAYYTPFLKAPIVRVYGDTLTSSINVNQTTSGIEWLDDAALGTSDRTADAFGLSLFPNPANTTVDLTYLTLGTARMTVEVTDVRGAVVLRKDLGGRSASMQRERLDVGALQPGLYQVTLTDAQGARSTQRLSIAR